MHSMDRELPSEQHPFELQQRDLRLAFFDIDGTLLGLDGHYSQRVRRAIEAVREAGVKTAVASGRPLFAAEFLVQELGLTDAGLFYTGALVHDPMAQHTLAQHALDDDLVQRLVQAARDLGLYVEVCGRDRFYVEHVNELGLLHSKHLRAKPLKVCFDDVLGREPVIKLLFAVQTAQQHQLLYDLEAGFPEAIFAYARMAAKPDWLFVSVISDAACKQQAFTQLLDYHEVSADQVIAFGDAQSDKVFLQLAGVGVAMGNASEDVKQMADLVTAPVWEDGVAQVLEGWLERR